MGVDGRQESWTAVVNHSACLKSIMFDLGWSPCDSPQLGCPAMKYSPPHSNPTLKTRFGILPSQDRV